MEPGTIAGTFVWTVGLIVLFYWALYRPIKQLYHTHSMTPTCDITGCNDEAVIDLIHYRPTGYRCRGCAEIDLDQLTNV